MKMTDSKKIFSENDSLKYRPYPIEKGKIAIKREHYSTSLDPRGYIPVYEYEINSQPIMWDRETGYIHFTGIWKALGNAKSEIVKMVDANPNLGTKKIRGGYLRIQGTWIPFDYAYLLCKRTAWKIRTELIPIFGPKFPSEALPPSHEDHGCLVLDKSLNVKSSNRNTTTTTAAAAVRQQQQQQQHPKNSKPYSKQSHTKKSTSSSSSTTSPSSSSSSTTRKSSLKPKPMKSCNNNIKSSSSSSLPKKLNTRIPTKASSLLPPIMSVNQLLNQDLSSEEEETESEDEEMEDDDDDDISISDTSSLSSFYSPDLLPSPTFRVIQTYPTALQLPPLQGNTIPINNNNNNNNSVLGATSVSQDIIDTISATILLQRLSQDDGARPFKPLVSSYIPSKVIVGHQEFTICWD